MGHVPTPPPPHPQPDTRHATRLHDHAPHPGGTGHNGTRVLRSVPHACRFSPRVQTGGLHDHPVRCIKVPARDRSHYSGSFQVRAARVRDSAYADPLTRCFTCGLTLAEKRRTKPDETWDAGHTVDGDSLFPLAAQHASCNRAAGAKAGHKKQALNPSRRWY